MTESFELKTKDLNEVDETGSTPALDRSVLYLFVGIALLSQIGFWFYGMPWPQLQGQQNLQQAITACLVSGVLLMLIPWVVAAYVMKRQAVDLGLGPGDVRFGLKAIFWCGPAMLIGTWIGTGDPQIQSFYPIPGDDIGQSANAMAQWFSAYLLYYVSFEVFYRGYLLRGLVRSDERKPDTQTVWTLIAVQALLCFLIHIGKPNIELAASLPASVLFGWIAWRSRSIWYGVVLHFLIGVVNDIGAMQ